MSQEDAGKIKKKVTSEPYVKGGGFLYGHERSLPSTVNVPEKRGPEKNSGPERKKTS